MNRDMKSGVSIIEVDPYKFDAGKILRQTNVKIAPDATYSSLVDDLGIIGGKELTDTLNNYVECKVRSASGCVISITMVTCVNMMQKNAREQNTEGGYSTTKKITIGMSVIDWNKDASQIEALHRAIGYLYDLRSTFRGKRIRLRQIKCADDCFSSQCIPGTLRVAKNCLYVKCGRGWISTESTSVGNSKFLTPTEMINGYKINDSDVLGV